MTDEIEVKAISDFEVKDAERGEVTAVVSMLNVVDRDRDVILPGAITDGASVKMSAFDHDIFTKRMPPVGRGVIKVEGDRVVFHGKYFMSTERGRDAFETVKALGPESEWSIGWPNSTLKTATMTDEWRAKGARRVISGIVVMEVSPVMLGANQFTRTVATKSAEDEAAAAAEKAEQDRLAAAEQERIAAEQAAAAAEQRKQDIMAAVEKTLAEMKAAEDAEAERKRAAEAAEQERLAIATKAAEEKAAADARKELTTRAEKEFARFRRNMDLYRVR